MGFDRDGVNTKRTIGKVDEAVKGLVRAQRQGDHTSVSEDEGFEEGARPKEGGVLGRNEVRFSLNLVRNLLEKLLQMHQVPQGLVRGDNVFSRFGCTSFELRTGSYPGGYTICNFLVVVGLMRNVTGT